MDTQKKTILFAVIASVATTVAIQQISYRNSIEYKLKKAFNLDAPSMVESESESNGRCDLYRSLKAQDPSWEPYDGTGPGSYYSGCTLY